MKKNDNSAVTEMRLNYMTKGSNKMSEISSSHLYHRQPIKCCEYDIYDNFLRLASLFKDLPTFKMLKSILKYTHKVNFVAYYKEKEHNT